MEKAERQDKNYFLQSAFSNFILLLVPSHKIADGVNIHEKK